MRVAGASQSQLFVSSFGGPGQGYCHSCPFQVWFILPPMHSSLPSTSPMALEYFNVRWPLMYEGKWDQWMERGAGTALQFVYTGQALRTAELTQRHSPSVLFHPFRNGRKAEGPPICFSWIMYLPGLAWLSINTISPAAHHHIYHNWLATPTINFCLNQAFWLQLCKIPLRKMAPACSQLGQVALTLQSGYWSSLMPGKNTSSSHTNSSRLLTMQL